MLQITGTLLTPLGAPLVEAEIRVCAINTATTFKGASATMLTGVDGSYSFTLGAGSYSIAIKQADKYTYGMEVTVPDITGIMSLPALVTDYPLTEI